MASLVSYCQTSDRAMADDAAASALLTLDFDELLAAELDALQRRLSEHHALMIAAVEVDCNRKLQEMNERMFDLDKMAEGTLQQWKSEGDTCEIDIDGNTGKLTSVEKQDSGGQKAQRQTSSQQLSGPVARPSQESGIEEEGAMVEQGKPRWSTGQLSDIAGKSIEESVFEGPFKRMKGSTNESILKGRTHESRREGSTNESSGKSSATSNRKRRSHIALSMISMYHDQDELELREAAEVRSVMPNTRYSRMWHEQKRPKWLDVVHKMRQSVGKFLRHPATELFIAGVILSNSIVVGLEVDWTVRNPQETRLPIGFSVIGYTFNILFAIEVALRMFALMGGFFTGSQWGWNVFDLSLVAASIVEFAIELLYLTGSQNFSSLRIVKIVRISRILRVLRVARVVRLLVALRLLFVQILGTLRSVFWAMVLLLLILYAFGMVFAQVASEHIADKNDGETIDFLEKYWSTVPRSMFTLYKAVTGGVDWENVAFALSDIHWIWVGVFVIYVSFTIFAVLNVVVGVFCQSAIESATLDHENSIRLKMREKVNFARKIRALFWDMSDTEEGELTYHELEAHLQDEQVNAYFETLGIDTSDAWDLFKLLDKDFSQCVDVEEFIRGIMHLRGPAKILDVEKLMFENRQMRKQLASFMRLMEMHLKVAGITPPLRDGSQSTRASHDPSGNGRVTDNASLTVQITKSSRNRAAFVEKDVL